MQANLFYCCFALITELEFEKPSAEAVANNASNLPASSLLTEDQKARNTRLMDERHGKMLLHTERALLSALEGVTGVVRMRDYFVDVCEIEEVQSILLSLALCFSVECSS